MPTFQDKIRSFSDFQVPIKNRNSRDSIRYKTTHINGAVDWAEPNLNDEVSLIIKQANTVKFTQVCKHYGIDIDQYNVKIQCPFKFHKDSSPSFQYYPDTNSFYCWGCKNSGYAVNFVALLENISKSEAAKKILDNFESNVTDTLSFTKSKEEEELHLKFSFIVREFIKNNDTPEALEFIDQITKWFDMFTQNHTVEPDGLKHIISSVEKRIKEYECL